MATGAITKQGNLWGTGTLDSTYFDTTDSSNSLLWVRNGNVVQVYFQATTIAEIPNGNVYLANGLPSVSTPLVATQALDVTNGASSPTFLGQVRISGTYINYPYNSVVPIGTKIRIMFTYICA